MMLFVVSLLPCDPGRKHHPYFSPRFTHESLIRRLFSLSFPDAFMIFLEFSLNFPMLFDDFPREKWCLLQPSRRLMQVQGPTGR